MTHLFIAEATVNSAGFLLLALYLGGLMTAGFILPRGEPAILRKVSIGLAFTLLLFFLMIGLVFLLVQGAKLGGDHFPGPDLLMRYVARTQSGSVWLAREAFTGVLLIATLWALRSGGATGPVRVLILISLPLVMSRSLMSHAIAVRENTPLIVVADSIHFIATASWAGTLPFVFWALFRGRRLMPEPMSWAGQVLSRFSAVALCSVAVLALTGLYQSWVHVGSLNGLFETSYGRVLALKLSLVLVMTLLGAVNFFSTRPQLLRSGAANQGPPILRKALRRIGAESFIGILVLGVTGFLTILPPPAHREHQSVQTNPHAPRKPSPAEGARVTILSPKNGQLFKGDQIPVRFRLIRGKRAEHVHAYVDGELMGMFKGERGTLTGIKPGEHVLELRPVAEDHQTELDATATVRFTTR